MKKILPYLMLAFTLVMTLCACGENSSETETVSGYVIDDTNILNYQVVRSDYAEGDLVQCGMDVRYAFEDAGYELKITTDFYREGNPAYAMGEYEILVGETNRPETQEFLDGLQMWQYGYALVGQKIVIAGHDDAATRLAVEEFKTFLAGKTLFTFSEADNFIYGEVKEGEGKVYSVLTYNFAGGREADVLAEVSEYTPDFLIVQNADDAVAELFATDGYALGADYTIGEFHNLMYYNTATYTYSSAGHLSMSQMPMLTDSEKGAFTYCVVRCAETKDKYVFCAADLSAVSEDGIKDRMKVFGNFAENCGELPVLFGGLYDGSADSTACELLTGYGYADVMRLAAESEGECTENYLYASYNNIAAVKSVVTGNGIYTEFQRAK